MWFRSRMLSGTEAAHTTVNPMHRYANQSPARVYNVGPDLSLTTARTCAMAFAGADDTILPLPSKMHDNPVHSAQTMGVPFSAARNATNAR